MGAGVISSCLNGGWGTTQLVNNGNGVNYSNGVQTHNNATFNSALTSTGTGNWHNDELPNNSVMVNPNNVMPINNIVGNQQQMAQPAQVSPMYNQQQQNYIHQQQHLQIQQQQRQQQQLLHVQQQQQQQQLNMRTTAMTKTVKVLPPASS